MSLIVTLANWILIVLPVLVNVAFITLLERKILGLSQLRLGPNKVSAYGVLQPMADAVKLFFNSNILPLAANKAGFMSGPVLALFLVLLLWGLGPNLSSGLLFTWSGVALLAMLSFGIYPVFFTGWFSNNKYASVGALRGIAQTISYEISFALLVLSIYLLSLSMNLKVSTGLNLSVSLLLITPELVVLWLVSSLAETNRTPFDFSEGESELVSGFNIEFSSAGFALIFMAEYGSIFFLAFMTVSLFISGVAPGKLGAYASLAVGMFIYFWVWARATYPRFRYDLLMSLAWKSVLPLSLVVSLMTISLLG